MKLDEELRGLLHERAEQMPGAAGLLDGVGRRSRQLARRRYAVVAGAVAVVLALLLPSVVLRARADAPPAGPSPTPPADAVAVRLVDGDVELGGFPFAVGWVPAGVSLSPGMRGSEANLNDVMHGLTVVVDRVPYTWRWQAAKVEPVTVNGSAATLRTATSAGDHPLVGVSWLSDGQWLTVESMGRYPADDVLRLARSIAPGETPPGRLPFTLHRIPAGFVVALVDQLALCLAPPDWPADRGGLPGLCVSASTGDPDPSGTPVTIGGRAGRRTSIGDHSMAFSTRLREGWQLTVSISVGPPSTGAGGSAWLAFSDADLDSFVAALTVP